MMGWSSLLLVVVFVGYGVENGCSIMGSPVSRIFPLGSIGCLFASRICQRGQECIDDRLFGTCQEKRAAKDMYQYLLDRDTLDSLESEIWLLIQGRFSWRDPHTQCLLQNILVSYRENEDFDRSICSSASQWRQNTESDISKVLKLFLKYYDRTEDKASFDNEPLGGAPRDEYAADYNSQKRDEFLKIHKYFAPSRSDWKRRVEDVPYVNENFQNNEIENEVDNAIRAMDGGDSLGYNDLTDDDVNKLQLYLDALQEVAQMYSNGDDMDIPDESSEEIEESELVPGESELAPSEGGGAFWSSSEISYPTSPAIDPEEQPLPGIDLSILATDDNSADNNPAIFPDSEDSNRKSMGDTLPADERLEETDNEISENGLSPRYAKLLADLLQDDLEPSKLSDKDLNQLTKIVNRLLQDLANQDNSISADVIDLKDSELSNDDLLGMVKSQDGSEVDPAYAELTAEGMASGEAPIETPSMENLVMKKSDISGNPETPNEVEGPESADKEEKPSTDPGPLGVVDATYAYMTVDKDISLEEGEKLVEALARVLQIPPSSFSVTDVHDQRVTFQISPDLLEAANASSIVAAAGDHKEELAKWTGLTIISAGIGSENGQVKIEVLGDDGASPKFFVLTFVLCGCIAGVLIGVVVLYLVKRHSRSKDKLAQLATEATGAEASQDYQDLCRQRMQSKTSEKPEPLHAAGRIGSVSESQVRSPSSRSSTSSWSEEPVTSSMDISTGHIVLSYMEDHLKNKDRLDREWEALTAYEADPCSTIVASDSANTRKNRYSDNLPYDHSRVVLADSSNVSGSDYINASTITDHDPRNPAYITTQGPLPHTVADFWQMVWEQGSVVVVMLTKLTENGAAMCHRYWPEEGSDLYHIYEVHLVSEHIWCDDYLVRSFYLKNLQTNETRTVTQFHFLTWHDNKVPGSVKALLDFRRKVNKSYRGRSCPIVVHCSDGSGRSGTYTLIDMVLNRLAKGAKEIDIAATLEHMRDQRMAMAKTKEQFEFVLAAVAEEVHAILKSLPQ